MPTFTGGNINSSFASHIIRKLSTIYNQSDAIKRHINSTSNSTITGHGSIFLGSSAQFDGSDNIIRILVGAHFSRHGELKIGVFGGKCEPNECTIDTVIRETIEEVFNFPVSPLMIYYIRVFLNEHPEFYYIHQISDKTMACSYFFDVSILGDFIRIIREIPKQVVLSIPTLDGLANIENFLQPNISIKDFSSFDDSNNKGINTTIKLIEFMKTRYISAEYKKKGIYKHISGMDEVKYLSFVTLRKLLSAVPQKHYELYNFTKNKRENLKIQELLIKILKQDIMIKILSFE
jgi:hypothetical protein